MSFLQTRCRGRPSIADLNRPCSVATSLSSRVASASAHSSPLSFSLQVLIAPSRQLDVTPGCLPRLLLERVQHVHRRVERRNDQDAMFSARVDSDFNHSRTNGPHWLPVARFATVLNEIQLTTSLAPSELREPTEIPERRATPLDWPPNRKTLDSSAMHTIYQCDIVTAMLMNASGHSTRFARCAERRTQPNARSGNGCADSPWLNAGLGVRAERARRPC